MCAQSKYYRGSEKSEELKSMFWLPAVGNKQKISQSLNHGAEEAMWGSGNLKMIGVISN
jgi:hypothetical protein